MAILASAAGCAKPLDILGTRMGLPFDYDIVKSSETLSRIGNGVIESQRIDIKPTDGPGKGESIVVYTRYFSPDHPDAKQMQAMQRKWAKAAAAEPGVRSASSVRIDGFDFEFVDGPIADKNHPQAMRVSGITGDAIYGLQVSAEDIRPLTTQLADRVKAIHIDQVDLHKTQSRLDEEGRLAVKDHRLETPFGDVTAPANADMFLAESMVELDGSGHPDFRMRGFALDPTYPGSQASMMLPDRFTVAMGCGKSGSPMDFDYDGFIRMTKEQADPDLNQKYSDVKILAPVSLLGLSAQTSRASGRAVDSWRLRHTSVSRWAAMNSDGWFMVSVDRYNGAPIENAMIRQLASAPAVCRIELPFGPDAPAADRSGAVPAASR